jgi:hypothetical protein
VAVNRSAAGFRGINGFLPMEWVPSIYSTTHFSAIDSHSRRDERNAWTISPGSEDRAMNDSIRFDAECAIDDSDASAKTQQRMSAHAPGLDRFLRNHKISYVRAEYCGADDRGGFIAIEFTRDDGAYCHISDATPHLQIKAVFRALLLARHPSWIRGHGSCGDFRWDLRGDSLTHSHYTRGDGNERLTHHGV